MITVALDSRGSSVAAATWAGDEEVATVAIESTEAGIMITGAHTELYRAAALCTALALEVNTGMGNSHGPIWPSANAVSSMLDSVKVRALAQEAGVKLAVPTLGRKRTKRGALADLTLFLILVWNWKPSDSVRRALGNELTNQITRKAERISKVIRPQVKA